MKIAHINNMANVAWTLAQAQKRLGHEAVVFSVYDYPSRFPYDVAVPHARGPVFWNAAMGLRLPTFSSFDVLHIHGGIWMTQLFYPLFRRMYPRTVLAVHFHGQDARTGHGLHHLSVANALFHSTQDLAPFVPGSEWLPAPVDLPATVPPVNNEVPRFGHFPFRWRPGIPESEAQKGTDRILRVFREAFGPVQEEHGEGVHRYRGHGAELLIVAGMPHERALAFMATCDAVIDQLSDFRIYGMAALEAMALAKPVLSNYNPEWFPGTPVVRFGNDPGSQLRELGADPALRRDLGRRSREFVERVHESTKVATRTLEVYRTAQERLARG
jgi:hypothetical protein